MRQYTGLHEATQHYMRQYTGLHEAKEFNGLTNNVHGLTNNVHDLINNEKYYRNLAHFWVNNIKENYFHFYFWQCN